MSTTNPFLGLQADVAKRLGEQALLHEMPILTESVGNIEAAIDEALAKGGVTEDVRGQPGIAILVMTPKARAVDESGPRLAALDVTVRVAVYENGVINRSDAGTNRPALDIIWNVIAQLQGWTMHRGAAPVAMVEMDSDATPEGYLVYYADFRFRRAFSLRAVD